MRLALATTLALLLLAAPAAEASKPKCRLPSNATVVGQNSLAIVYSVPRLGVEPVYRACVRKSARKLLLPTSDVIYDDAPEVSRMTLAGRYVGWAEIHRDRYGQSSGRVKVYDLRKERLRWAGHGPDRVGGDAPEFTDFALGENGRVAYITLERRVEYRDPDGKPGEWRTVWARDASNTRKLEEGRDAIDLTSLDLSGLTATWVSGGQPRSAELY